MHTLMETIGNLPAKLGGSSQTPPFQSSESFEHPTYWASSEKKALTASVFTELALYAECPEGALDLKAVFEMIQRASRKVATILQTSASCSVRHRQQPEALGTTKKIPAISAAEILREANARARSAASRRSGKAGARVGGKGCWSLPFLSRQLPNSVSRTDGLLCGTFRSRAPSDARAHR